MVLMKIDRINISNIPSIIWGKKSNRVFIAVHGNMSNKEDDVIKILAEKVINRGYQLLSFDLPELIVLKKMVMRYSGRNLYIGLLVINSKRK